jgi:hypothetical protein
MPTLILNWLYFSYIFVGCKQFPVYRIIVQCASSFMFDIINFTELSNFTGNPMLLKWHYKRIFVGTFVNVFFILFTVSNLQNSIFLTSVVTCCLFNQKEPFLIYKMTLCLYCMLCETNLT